MFDLLPGIGEYLVRIEPHRDNGLHIHCFLAASVGRFEIYSKNYLDIDLRKYIVNILHQGMLEAREDKGLIHGNYQSGKKIKEIKRYILKEVNLLDPLEVSKIVCSYTRLEQLQSIMYENAYEHLADVAKNQSIKVAHEVFINEYPELYLKKGSVL